MKIAIVIPTYNEAENIGRLIEAIFNLGIPECAMIVVDDASPDGTGQIVEQYRSTYPVYHIARNKKMGLGSAYIMGFKKALAIGADVIIEMDADFSHDPVDIPRLAAALHDADVTVGSRRVQGGKIAGWGARRRFTSWGATHFARLLLGLSTRDVTAGFRAYRRTVLASMNLDAITSNGYAFQEETLYHIERGGYRIVEIPVVFTDRKKGKSKLGGKEILEFFTSMLRLRFFS